MVETIVLIAIPAIAFVVTTAVVIRGELKAKKLRDVMFGERKRCIRFVLESKLMSENERLRKENARLRDLVYVVYAYYASGTISPCDICDSTGCQYVGEAESGCRYHDRYDAAEAANDEILRRMHELGIDTKELI